MQEITQWEAARLLPLFGGLDLHLAVSAVLHHAAAGRVWLDDAATPQTGVIWTAHRIYVGGAETGAGAAAASAAIHQIAAAAQVRGDWGIGVYGTEQTAWDSLLDGLTWQRMAREYWEAVTAASPDHTLGDTLDHTVNVAPGGGLHLRTVAAELLAEPWAGLVQLRAEMCSERASVADFLARSFGVCLVTETDRALAGWCLSEYNCGPRCEVGIEVLEAYQRRGLGTRLASALRLQAAAQGVTRVGWHCLAANAASGATARAAGLALVTPYTAAVVLLRSN